MGRKRKRKKGGFWGGGARTIDDCKVHVYKAPFMLDGMYLCAYHLVCEITGRLYYSNTGRATK